MLTRERQKVRVLAFFVFWRLFAGLIFSRKKRSREELRGPLTRCAFRERDSIRDAIHANAEFGSRLG
jgi:hypothetical protein